MVQPLRKTAWKFLKKLKIALPYDSAISLLSGEKRNSKRSMDLNVQDSTIYNSQDTEATCVH